MKHLKIKGKIECIHHDYIDPKHPKSILYIKTRKGEVVLTRPYGFNWEGNKTDKDVGRGDIIYIEVKRK